MSGFGLYVHWPWCRRICPYCDFNVFRARGQDTGAMVRAIGEAIRLWPAHGAPLRPLTSIHFGGGTPSLAAPEAIAEIIEIAGDTFGLADGAEIGLEANPEDASADIWAAYRRAGVERLSLGVQALDDADLRALGRVHSAAEGRHSIEMAREIFPRVSADLIAARAGQSAAAWENELAEALSLGLTHLSVYQLTIEDNTAFGRAARRGAFAGAPEDIAADIYEATQRLTRAAGLDAYEVSNHAAGEDNTSRHNLVYWRSGDWIAAGPGAHARLWGEGGRRLALAAPRRPEAYEAAVAAGAPAALEESLAPHDSAAEMILMGLRLAEGLDVGALEARTGLSPDPDGAARLAEAGLVSVTPGRIAATDRGRLVLDRLAAELAP